MSPAVLNRINSEKVRASAASCMTRSTQTFELLRIPVSTISETAPQNNDTLYIEPHALCERRQIFSHPLYCYPHPR